MVKIRINDAQRCRGDYSLFVSFDFSMEIVDTLKSYPVRYYNPDTKEWELPFKDLNYLQSDLKAHSTTIVDERTNTQDDEKSCSALKYSNRRDIGEVLNEFKFKTKPFNHQLDGIVYGLEHCSWLLGDEQGLGKTKQAIDLAIINKAQFGYEHCLIICGVNGLKWNWKQEISIHSNEVGYIIGQRTNKNGKVVIKSSKEKLEDLNKIDTLPYFIITNVESLRNKDILDKIVKYCKNGKIAMCIADEIHKCFDYNSKVTTDKGLISIGDIVTNKLNVKVKSYNKQTNTFEWKQITNWFKNEVSTNLLELKIQTAQGIKTIKCTDTHKFYTTNRGWVKAKDLTDEDDLLDIL